MAYAPINGTGNGTAPVVNLTWPFIAQTDVYATVNGVAAAFTWTGTAQITFSAAVANGTPWQVYRLTSVDPQDVSFTDNSVLTAAALNLAQNQHLYALTELRQPTVGSQLLSASNGASLVGYIDNGTGAVTTTVQSFLQQLNQLPTGNWYAPSAKVQRLNERVLVAAAALNNATNVASQPDWLTTYELGQGRSFGAIQSGQMAVLSAGGQGSNALIAGARTSTLLGDTYNAVGIWGVAVNDRGVGTSAGYGGYFEGHRKNAGSGAVFGVEIDIINFVSTSVSDPFTNTSPETIGLQLASGGQYAPASLFSATAALAVRNNGARFLSGLIFGADAIALTGGIGEAIAFASGHSMNWYGAAAAKTHSIYSTVTTAANGINQFFDNGFIRFQDAVSLKHAFLIQKNANGVNFLAAANAATGNTPVLAAYGDDPNVDLAISPQGTGLVKFGNGNTMAANGTVATALTSVGPTGSHTTVQEWLQVKNASGVIRYIPAF